MIFIPSTSCRTHRPGFWKLSCWFLVIFHLSTFHNPSGSCMRSPSLVDGHYEFRGQAPLLGPRESDRAWTVLSPHCEPNDAWLIIRLVIRNKTGMITHHFEETKFAPVEPEKIFNRRIWQSYYTITEPPFEFLYLHIYGSAPCKSFNDRMNYGLIILYSFCQQWITQHCGSPPKNLGPPFDNLSHYVT